MEQVAIHIDRASVRFNMATEKIDNIKEYFVRLIKRQLMFQEFFALEDISLTIRKGESWGIVGTNGSGKSTLLKLICGIIEPYRGEVHVSGRIAPLIELGAGMDGRLTARENIFLNGILLGHSRAYMKKHFDEIVEFAGIGKFLDMPIKNYSSGMAARLGFSIATMVQPEILIVDEVLAVGDSSFKQKCNVRMQEMLSNGTTLLMVSHVMGDIKRLCKNVLWLDKGKIVESGEAASVCDNYIAARG